MQPLKAMSAAEFHTLGKRRSHTLRENSEAQTSNLQRNLTASSAIHGGHLRHPVMGALYSLLRVFSEHRAMNVNYLHN